jgi:hypothetical protein
VAALPDSVEEFERLVAQRLFHDLDAAWRAISDDDLPEDEK